MCNVMQQWRLCGMILWIVNVKSDYRWGEGGRQGDAAAVTFPLMSCKGMEVHFSSCC